MQVEIAVAVLAEPDAGMAVGQHRTDIGPVGLVIFAGDDAERGERLADRFGLGLAPVAELAVDLPDAVGAEVAFDQRIMRLLAIFGAIVVAAEQADFLGPEP